MRSALKCPKHALLDGQGHSVLFYQRNASRRSDQLPGDGSINTWRMLLHVLLCFFLQNAKAECDKVIDKNGPPPIGTGIKQLRENIAESKLSYEIMDDAGE